MTYALGYFHRHMDANLQQARAEQQRNFSDMQVPTHSLQPTPFNPTQAEIERMHVPAPDTWRPPDRLAFEQREASLMQDVLRRRERVQ